jgi:hypothetical protein
LLEAVKEGWPQKSAPEDKKAGEGSGGSKGGSAAEPEKKKQ